MQRMDALVDALHRFRYVWIITIAVVIGAGGVIAAQRVLGEGDRVRVTEDGKVSVTDRDNLPFQLSFDLPQNCSDVLTEFDAALDQFPGSSSAPPAVNAKIAVLALLGEELCSYREWTDVQAGRMAAWYGVAPSES